MVTLAQFLDESTWTHDAYGDPHRILECGRVVLVDHSGKSFQCIVKLSSGNSSHRPVFGSADEAKRDAYTCYSAAVMGHPEWLDARIA